MKLHWSYILAEIVKDASTQMPPPAIDGNASPRHAYQLGYIAALQDAVDALSAAEKQPVAAE